MARVLGCGMNGDGLSDDSSRWPPGEFDSRVRRRRLAVLCDHLDHVSGGYEPQIRAALDASCRQNDIDLLLVVGRPFDHPDPVDAAHNGVFELLGRESVDAVIFLSAGLSAFSGVGKLAEFRQRFGNMPVCSVGAAVPGVPSVVVDNGPGMRSLVEHVIRAHGRRKLAFISGTPKNPDAEARLAAYREVLEQHEIPFDPRLVATGFFHTPSGARAVHELLDRRASFDALIVSNDAMALSAVEALKSRGLRVPRDVVVTGFDDLVLARLATPSLTSVRQPLERMGVLAVELICRQFAGEAVPLVSELPVEFVPRESCGCQLAWSPRSVQPGDSLGPARPPVDRERLAARLTAAAFEPLGQAAGWVNKLVSGLEAELDSGHGALLSAVEDILDDFGDAHECFERLQRAIVTLSHELRSSQLDALWQSAHRTIESQMARALARQKLQMDAVFQNLLRSGERLSTASLDWPGLERVMYDELREVALQNACISLYPSGDPRRLKPFVWIHDGRSRRYEKEHFESVALAPPGAFDRRRTWVVLPLTFETEQLGVAAFELGTGVVVYEMLRGQISAALKSAALHQEIVRTTALHVRSVEERVATSNRMASLSVLAGGVAHDLNNALGPLVTLPDVILADLDDLKRGELTDDEELRTDVITIKSSALRAAQTIKDLMLLGRPGPTSKESHDLNDIVASFAAADPLRMPGQRGAGIPIVVDLALEPLMVTVSEPHVVRALTNLARNAAEAMGEAGRITISTRAVTLATDFVRHETIPAGRYAVVSVADTGHGIGGGDLARVFEPFFSTKRLADHSGSGLGLAIVHGVVKEHSGYVDVESVPGVGTTFALYFSCTDEANQPSGVVSVPPRRLGRILVVGDEPSQLHLVGRVLRHLSYAVDTLESGQEALERYAKAKRAASLEGKGRPPYDLVIFDHTLHERRSGIMALRRMREFCQDQRAILVTGYGGVDEAESVPGVTWLFRPYGAAELALAVERALEPEVGDRNPGVSSRSR